MSYVIGVIHIISFKEGAEFGSLLGNIKVNAVDRTEPIYGSRCAALTSANKGKQRVYVK